MRTGKIYTLSDPRNGEIKYIGRTFKKIKYRLSEHCAEKDNNKKCNWIKSLAKQNLKPIIE